MIKTKKLLANNVEKHPEFKEGQDLLTLIEDNPGKNRCTSIAACNSYIESISKTILDLIPGTGKQPQNWSRLVSDAISAVRTQLPDSVDAQHELLLLNSLHRSIKDLDEIRNKRSEVAHGPSFLNRRLASDSLAEMVLSTTDTFCFHLLEIFFSLELKQNEGIQYGDNEKFNDMLDEENTFNGVSFSKALFDQDLVAYEELLTDYLADENNQD